MEEGVSSGRPDGVGWSQWGLAPMAAAGAGNHDVVMSCFADRDGMFAP